MKPVVQTTFAERLGRMLGRAWRGCVGLDRRANGWLVAQGWTPNVAKVVLAVLKLTALGILLYVAFWLALLIGGILAAAWIARQDNTESDALRSYDITPIAWSKREDFRERLAA